MQFHSLTIHTRTCGKYIVHDTLTHSQSLRNYYKINSHRARCLSLTQVAPGHVSDVLAMNTERVKPENPN